MKMESKCERRLLDKFDLEIDQLDYKYIKTCKDVKKLDKILRVLRSGEEGIYPDLIRFCENRLKDVFPQCSLLHPVKKISDYSDLTKDEKAAIQSELQTWSRDMKEQSSVHNSVEGKNANLPPVRSTTRLDSGDPGLKENHVESKSHKLRTYEEWNKYNVEEELKKLEEEEKENEKPKQEVQTLKISEKLSLSGLSPEECQRLAYQEKLKGNEAYRSEDYAEAIIYYTRSLSAAKTVAGLSNRAQAHFKLKNYVSTILDCNEVIGLDPDNIKALYRRGLSYKESEEYVLAKLDFKTVLELDPNNKAAQEQIEKLKQLKFQKKKPTKRVIIEELETIEVRDHATEASARLQIEEVSSLDIHEKIQEAMDDSGSDDEFSHLSRSTQEMLTLNTRQKGRRVATSAKKEREKTEKQTPLALKESSVSLTMASTNKQKSRNENVDLSENKIIGNEKISSVKKCSARSKNDPCLKEITGSVDELDSSQGNALYNDLEKSSSPNCMANSIEKFRTESSEHSKLKASENCTEFTSLQGLLEPNTNSKQGSEELKSSSQTNMDNETSPFMHHQSNSNRDGNNTSKTQNCFTSLKVTNDSLSIEEPIENQNKVKKCLFEKDRVSSLENESTDYKSSVSSVCAFENNAREKRKKEVKFEIRSTFEVLSKQEVGNQFKDWPQLQLNSTDSKRNISNIKTPNFATKKVTPFEFMQLWSSCTDDDFRAQLLHKATPQDLPIILGNQLDAPLLLEIVSAVVAVIRMGKFEEGIEYLAQLMKVSRIQVIAMFLSSDDKKYIKSLLEQLNIEHEASISKIKDVLNILC